VLLESALHLTRAGRFFPMGSVDAPTPNKHHREADREEYSVDADRELATAQEALAAAEASARASGAFLAEAETDARRRHSVVHADTLARLVDSGSAVERASTLAALALGPEDDRWAAAAVLLDDANDPTHIEFRGTLAEVERICDSYMASMETGPELVREIELVLARLLQIQSEKDDWEAEDNHGCPNNGITTRALAGQAGTSSPEV
jgi:hypothetical protein